MAVTPMRTGTGEGPTTEIGYPTMTPMKWSMWVSDWDEEAADLRWPTSVRVYHKMRTDAQLHALNLAITLPIRRARWVVDPNGARDEVVESVATSLALPIQGQEDPPPRARRRFNHDDHLRHALLAITYGFMFFEQVGMIREDMRWQLTKLAPRMPQSLSKIDTTREGDLVAIRQWPEPGDPFEGKPIPESVLAPYVWEKEGGNWLGRSMLRPCFKHWMLKDRLLRVDAMKHERFGIGIPQAKPPAGATRETIERYAAMARAIRADAQSGVGLPAGAEIGVEGIKGSLPDTLASIQYQDEAMARNFLAMFLELGSTRHGSRALGESFVDFFKMGVDAVSEWYADTTNEYVVEDMVDWNYGPDENAPLVTWDEDPESRMDANDLVALIDAGAIVVDDELRTWITDRWGVADPGPDTPTPPGPSQQVAHVPGAETGQTVPAPEPLPAAAGRRRHAARGRRPFVNHHHRGTRVSQASSQTLHDSRVGHREPTQVELAAKTDFAKVQQQWQDRAQQLVSEFTDVRSQQINELVQQVAAAVEAMSVDDLAGIMAETTGSDLIATHMIAMLEDAVVVAKDEAKAQGVTMPTIDLADVTERIRAQADAIAELITRGISNSAATQGLQRYGVSELSASEVAQGVRDHLEGLSDSYLNDMLGGAMTQAQNAGRAVVMQESPGTAYASELLDDNTCDACADVDGTEYATIDDALQDYPAGGFSECAGGTRCRGTIVAVYDEATTT